MRWKDRKSSMKNPVFYLQYSYMIILNLFFRFLSKLSEKLRNAILWISVFALIGNYFIRESVFTLKYKFTFSTTQWTILCTFLLLIIILFSIKEPLKILKINAKNKVFVLFYFITPILIIISSFDHKIGNGVRPFALAMLIVFPCLYFVWSNRGDYHTLFNMISWALVVFGTILLIVNVAYFFWHIEDFDISAYSYIRYVGIFTNPNIFGLTTVAIFTGAFYLLYTAQRNIKAFLIIIMILYFMMVLLSGSRTSLLAIVAQIIVLLIFVYKSKHDKKKYLKKKTKKIILVCASIVIIIPIVLSILSMSNVISYNDNSLIKIPLSIQRLLPNNNLTINELSSGRIAFWLEYLKEITLIGKDPNKHHVIVDGLEVYGAHNTTIEVAYRSGILAGISITILLFSTLPFLLRGVKRSRERCKSLLFSCMAIIAYFPPFIIEVPFSPFHSFSSYILCFYIAIGPLMFKKEDVPLNATEQADLPQL